MIFEDFELLATDLQIFKEEGQRRVVFQVQIPRSPVGEQIESIMAGYDLREMRQRLKALEAREFDWPGVVQLGAWLGTILFPGPIHQLLVRSLDLVKAQGKGLRLRLLLANPLHNIPWEYVLLNQGGGEATITDFLGLMSNVSITRHQAATLPTWEIKAERPVRMVVALASPEEYAAIDLDKEHQVIEQALIGNPTIRATFVKDATSEALFKDVDHVHLFHFAGHGDFDQKMGDQPGTVEGEGVIILDDGSNDPQPLRAGQLALQLCQAGVRVAVLGACRSGRRDDVNVWSSVAAALLKAELGAVVGMQYTILDKSGTAFAEAFYQALVAGLSIDEAVINGRITVARTDDPRDWGVPVLYLRSPDGVIFPEYAADSALEKARQQLRLSTYQEVEELYGELIGIKVKVMAGGVAESRQRIHKVGEGGKAIGMEIEELGGTASTDQRVDKVDKGGSVTGLKIDKLG